MRIREHLPKITALLVTIPAVVIAVSLHWFFLRAPAPVGFDDGYTVALGERLIDGSWLPYVDGCSHRGPLLYWLTAMFQALSGRFNWAGPRWMMFLSGMVSLFSLVGIGFAARIPLAGAVAALFYVWLAMVMHDVEAGFAVTGEAIGATFGVVALLFCTLGSISASRPGRRLALLALAGASASLAGFVKQTAFPMFAPLLAWVIAVAVSEEGLTRRLRWGLVGACLVGFLLPVAIIVGRYAFAGELGTFWYWFYTYNTKVYMAPFASVPMTSSLDEFVRRHPLQFGGVAALVTFGLVRPLLDLERFPRGFFRAYAASGLEVTTALMTAAIFVGIASPKRFWLSYWVLLFPFLGLLLGIRAAALVSRARGHFAAQLAGHLLLGGLLTAWMGYMGNLRVRDLTAQRRGGGWQPALPEKTCELLDQHSGPDDSIFIWGFDADLYVTCHRHVGVRYTYSTLVAGTVPPFWKDVRPERVARDAHELIVKDIQESKPKVILDMPDRMRGISFNIVPGLDKYVRHGYCFLEKTKTQNGRPMTVYVRRDLPACQKPKPTVPPAPVAPLILPPAAAPRAL